MSLAITSNHYARHLPHYLTPVPSIKSFSSCTMRHLLPSKVVLACLALGLVVVEPALPPRCMTAAHTADADPLDHRDHEMWSWTSDQLRQRCAVDFFRLSDGTLSARCLVNQGADPYHPLALQRECFSAELHAEIEADIAAMWAEGAAMAESERALHYAGDSKGFPVFLWAS